MAFFILLSIGSPGSCAGFKPILSLCLFALSILSPALSLSLTTLFMTPAFVTPAFVTPAFVTPAFVTPAFVTPIDRRVRNAEFVALHFSHSKSTAGCDPLPADNHRY